eukprot:5212003-Amphidinium_carterae.1
MVSIALIVPEDQFVHDTTRLSIFGLSCFAGLAGMLLSSKLFFFCLQRVPHQPRRLIWSLLLLGGCSYALDVTVTHGAPTLPVPVHQALHSAKADKYCQDRVPQVGSLLLGDVKFHPLVHHFTGMLGASLSMGEVATKSAVADGTPWQLAIGRSKASVYQQLTFAHMRSQHRMCKACGNAL